MTTEEKRIEKLYQNEGRPCEKVPENERIYYTNEDGDVFYTSKYGLQDSDTYIVRTDEVYYDKKKEGYYNKAGNKYEKVVTFSKNYSYAFFSRLELEYNLEHLNQRREIK